jgi:hypothetical protein
MSDLVTPAAAVFGTLPDGRAVHRDGLSRRGEQVEV